MSPLREQRHRLLLSRGNGVVDITHWESTGWTRVFFIDFIQFLNLHVLDSKTNAKTMSSHIKRQNNLRIFVDCYPYFHEIRCHNNIDLERFIMWLKLLMTVLSEFVSSVFGIPITKEWERENNAKQDKLIGKQGKRKLIFDAGSVREYVRPVAS